MFKGKPKENGKSLKNFKGNINKVDFNWLSKTFFNFYQLTVTSFAYLTPRLRKYVSTNEGLLTNVFMGALPVLR